MRVVHIVPKPPYQGGLETFAAQLCEQLVERGNNVTWYCLNKSINQNKKRLKHGILIKEFKVLLGDPFFIPSCKFLTELEQEDADIFHVHNVHTLLPALLVVFLMFKKNFSAKIVLQPHYHVYGQSFVRDLLFSIYKKLLKLMILPHFKVILANSKFEQTVFMRDFPKVSHRMVLIPEEYSIDIPSDIKWNPTKNPKKILYVGALRKYKNVGVLINSFKLLVPELNDLELTIVGKGEQREELMKLATSLRVDDCIVWKNGLTYTELLKEYSEASVVVHLSELESFSRVVHEAMALGTPILVYNHGALGSLVKQGLAKGVKNLNPSKTAEAIDAVIKNQWKPKSPGFPSKGESYVVSIEKLYKTLLSKHRTTKT